MNLPGLNFQLGDEIDALRERQLKLSKVTA